MNNHFQPKRILSVYLIVGGIAQLILYSLMLASENLGWLFYFDPRIGLFFAETLMFGTEHTPSVLGVLSAFLLIVIGGLLRYRDYSIGFYFIAEILFSFPSLIFFMFIVAAGLSPNHGFSVGELVIPVPVFIVFTLVPLSLAVWSKVKERKEFTALILE